MKHVNLYTRAPTASDVPRLCELMVQLEHPIQPHVMLENIHKYNAEANHKAWIVELDGTVVGCVAASITHTFHEPHSFLRIISLVVDLSHRNHGIGKHLLKVAEGYAKEMNCASVELTSGVRRIAAHEFYKSQGYNELNQTKKYLAKKLS